MVSLNVSPGLIRSVQESQMHEMQMCTHQGNVILSPLGICWESGLAYLPPGWHEQRKGNRAEAYGESRGWSQHLCYFVWITWLSCVVDGPTETAWKGIIQPEQLSWKPLPGKWSGSKRRSRELKGRSWSETKDPTGRDVVVGTPSEGQDLHSATRHSLPSALPEKQQKADCNHPKKTKEVFLPCHPFPKL